MVMTITQALPHLESQRALRLDKRTNDRRGSTVPHQEGLRLIRTGRKPDPRRSPGRHHYFRVPTRGSSCPSVLRFCCVCALACGIFVAACGGGDDAAAAAAVAAGRWLHQQRQDHRRQVDERRQGHRHVLPGQGHLRRRHAGGQGVQRREPGVDGQAARVPDIRGRAARSSSSSARRPSRRVRRLLVGRDLDGGVRLPEVAVRHDAVRRQRARPSSSRRRSRPSRTTARSGRMPQHHGRRVPVLPRRPGQDPARHLAGGLPGGQGQRRHRLPGRAVRGPDVRLPRAGVRGRRQGPLRRTARSRRSTRRRTSRRCSSWSTASRTAPRPTASRRTWKRSRRRYLEAGKATFMRNWPYAYALGEKKGTKVAGKFKVMPFPTFEGGGKAAILGGHNLGDLRLLEEPGRRPEVHRLHVTGAGAGSCSSTSSLAGAGARVGLRRPGGPEDVSVRARAQAGGRSRPRRVRCRRSTRRSRRRSTTTSTRLCRARSSPQDAMKTADDQINKALATF